MKLAQAKPGDPGVYTGEVIERNPLTEKGRKVLSALQGKYGSKKGKRIFYALVNSGKISGIH